MITLTQYKPPLEDKETQKVSPFIKYQTKESRSYTKVFIDEGLEVLKKSLGEYTKYEAVTKNYDDLEKRLAFVSESLSSLFGEQVEIWIVSYQNHEVVNFIYRNGFIYGN